MTDPRSFLTRMLIVLVLVAILAVLMADHILFAFMGNPYLNGTIIAVALFGIGFIMRQVLRLAPEVRWLRDIQRTKKLNPNARKPVVLATVNVMLADSHQDRRLSALSLRSVLDGVAARLDEGRELSRYLIGLLIFLGLLGTFWGLLQTIGAVGNVVDGLDMSGGDFDSMMAQLQNGLDAPLGGMATAFSSSLFGLAGSLILGFLDLQLGQAMGRFFNEVEDWLSAFARYNDLAENPASGAPAGHSALAQGLSEEGARALLALAQAMERAEADRQLTQDRLVQLTASLTGLSAQLAERNLKEAGLHESVSALNARLEGLAQQLGSQTEQGQKNLASEMRALSSAVLKLAVETKKS